MDPPSIFQFTDSFMCERLCICETGYTRNAGMRHERRRDMGKGWLEMTHAAERMSRSMQQTCLTSDERPSGVLVKEVLADLSR